MLTLMFGLTVALIGMGTVFAVLILLVGFITLMGRATRLAASPRAPKAAAVPARAPGSSPTADDGELPAVIAAAIRAYRGQGR
ncbi:MAG: OadG family protein [Syntrophaceae bacterium]|nr:OadG family protein [Syntrophaceae bacterium]